MEDRYGPNNPPRLRKPSESVEDYRAAMGWGQQELVDVKKIVANNYCLILRALGMEEDGNPVEEVERLIEAEEILRWAYSKLHYVSYSNQDDALMLDRMKLMLSHSAA